MKYTNFNIALALTISLISFGQSYAQEISLDKLSEIKPVACTSQSCNTAKQHHNLNPATTVIHYQKRKAET